MTDTQIIIILYIVASNTMCFALGLAVGRGIWNKKKRKWK
jgi:hypothetical protein